MLRTLFHNPRQISKSIVLLIISITLLFASPDTIRPKIGLALSGGGARGIAHIGVLKVLEDAGIHVDYITGVSMGSIVGGSYAMGYSADELKKIFTEADWDMMVGDETAQNHICFEEKNYFNNHLIRFPFINNKFTLPGGLVAGHQIINMLSKYTWGSYAMSHFDSLSIPFKCLAMDIENCQKVILEKGPLAYAMRASMSVPTAFTPARIDSMLLIDGGLVRNLAVDELKDMGADIIIASYTGRKLSEKQDLNSLTSILTQSTSFVGLQDSRDQMNKCNYLIHPKYDDIGVTSFSKADTLIQRGYDAALPFYDTFKHLADSLNTIGKPYPAGPSWVSSDDIYVDSIAVIGNTTTRDKQIRKILNISTPVSLSQEYLNKRINTLYSSNYFKKISYYFKHIRQKNVLFINCTEDTRIHFTSSFYYDNYLKAGLDMNFTIRNFLLQQSQLNINLFLAEKLRIKTHYLRYFDSKQNYSLGLQLNLFSDELPLILVNDNRYKSYKTRNFSQTLRLSRYLGTNRRLSIAMENENEMFRPVIWEKNARIKSYSTLNTLVNYESNTLDNKHFPSKGRHLKLSYKELKLYNMILIDSVYTFHNLNYTSPALAPYVQENSTQLSISYQEYLKVFKKISLSFGLNVELSTDTSLSQNNSVMLGGTSPLSKRGIPFYGFKTNEIITKNAMGMHFALHYRPLKDINLSLIGNGFVFSDDKIAYFASDIAVGYGFEMGYNSPVGPLKVTLMQGGYLININHFDGLKLFVSFGYRL